jgi:hypothetical protein
VVSFDGLDAPAWTVSGTVSGLGRAQIVLRLNAQLLRVGDGPFSSSRLAEGTTYALTIEAKPQGYRCSIAGGEGVVAGANVRGVEVRCVAGTASSDPPAGMDAGTQPATDADAPPADAAVPDAAGGPDAASPCTNNPRLRDNTAGFACAFAPPAEAVCTAAETCCNPSTRDALGNFFPSFCATGKSGDATCAANAAAEGSTYDAGSAWECADKTACTAGAVCCLVPKAPPPASPLVIANTTPTDPNHPPQCGVKRSYNEGGSRCTPTCAAGEIRLCSLSDTSCTGGATCTPFLCGFRELGYCN